MARYAYIALCAALCLTVASAVTASSSSLTTASFADAPGKVFDYTVTADSTTWGTYTNVWFGPGTTNSTVYAYGIAYGVTASKITKIASRPLNASLLGNGTADTTMAAVGTDAALTGLTITADSTPVVAVGLGSIGIAYVASDSATVPCKQVYLSIYAGGGSSLTLSAKAVTSLACTACTYTSSSSLTTGTGYDITINSVWYDNSTYYVAYTTTKYVQTPAASSDCTANTAPTTADTNFATQDTTTITSYLQGVAASSTGTLSYTTTVPTIFAGTAAAAGATPSPTVSGLALKCGQSNQSNSTTGYCVYRTGATLPVLTLIPVTLSSGTVGSAVTLATDATTTAATYPLTTNTFTCAGFVYSQYIQGVLINNYTLVTSAASSPTYTYSNTLQFYNLTSGATATANGVALSGISNTVGASGSTSSQYAAAGITYGTGFAVLDQYVSTAGSPNTVSYEFNPFLGNGTLNGSKTTVAAVQGSNRGNWFVDANGGLWFGAYSYDTATSPYYVLTGSLGQQVAQIYYSAGNVLASFFALLSLMIAALFAF